MFSASDFCFLRCKRAFRIIRTHNAEKTVGHNLTLLRSKLTSGLIAERRRLPLLLIAALSISLSLQLHIGYAQDAPEQPTSNAKVDAVQNSIADASPSPTQDKGDQGVNVKTFGAVGDGVTDDTAAFNSALASLTKAGGGTCLVPKGTYLISATTNPAITSHVSSNVHLVGQGRQVSILKIAGMPAGNFLFCSGDNWSVEDLAVDMQDYFVQRGGFAAIVAAGTNWRISNCAIIKIGRRGINVNGGANGYIVGNLIAKTAGSPHDNSSIISVVDGKGNFPTNIHIIDNVCVNSAIYFKDGKDSLIARNRVSGSQSGTGIITGVHSDNISVINNTCSGGRGRDETGTYISGFELWAPNSVIANNNSYDNDGAGIAVGGNNSIVIGNRCWNNASLSGVVGGSGIVAVAHKKLPNAASGSLFIGNSCFDTRPRGAMTQAFGFNDPGNGLTDIKQFGNDYGRNKMGATHHGPISGRPNLLQIHANDTAASPISPEMKNKLKALANANDTGMSDSTRRILRQYLNQ
jgi:Pectate lyase superfamily protein